MLSVNISVWIPKSCLSFNKIPTAFGIPPIPNCKVAPSGTKSAIIRPIFLSFSDNGGFCNSDKGLQDSHNAVTSEI